MYSVIIAERAATTNRPKSMSLVYGFCTFSDTFSMHSAGTFSVASAVTEANRVKSSERTVKININFFISFHSTIHIYNLYYIYNNIFFKLFKYLLLAFY